MTLTLSIASLRKHNACDLDERIADLRRVLPDVTDDTPVPLRTWWDLADTESVDDRLWSLRAVEPALDGCRLGVHAACLAARRALPLTREQDRPACLAAIEAAEAWAADPTEERAAHAHAAADAAVAVAHAAYAVAAAYAAIGGPAHAARAYYAANATAYAARITVDAVGRAAAYAACAAYDARAVVCVAEREAQRADLDRLISAPEGT